MSKLTRILATFGLVASLQIGNAAQAAMGIAENVTVGDGIAAYSLQDYERARDIWRKLAAEGDVEAARRLAGLYQLGRGVEPDFDKAAEFLAMAADAGSAAAQYELGALYAGGRGVPQDFFRAYEYLLLAAEQDHGRAQYDVGRMLFTGELGSPDLVSAAVWFQRAADNLQEGAPRDGALAAAEAAMSRLNEDEKTEVLRRLAGRG